MPFGVVVDVVVVPKWAGSRHFAALNVSPCEQISRFVTICHVRCAS